MTVTYSFLFILLGFADHLIYYTRKEVTYELLTHEYNYWRWANESIQKQIQIDIVGTPVYLLERRIHRWTFSGARAR